MAEKLLAPMRALGPEVDLFQPMPYTVVQSADRRRRTRTAAATTGGRTTLADFDDKLTDTLLEPVGDDAVAVQRAARR